MPHFACSFSALVLCGHKSTWHQSGRSVSSLQGTVVSKFPTSPQGPGFDALNSKQGACGLNLSSRQSPWKQARVRTLLLRTAASLAPAPVAWHKYALQEDWYGEYESVSEFGPVRAKAEGKIPKELRGGIFVRNGPGNFDRGGIRYNHIIDGDGFLLQARKYQLGSRLVAAAPASHSWPFRAAQIWTILLTCLQELRY